MKSSKHQDPIRSGRAHLGPHEAARVRVASNTTNGTSGMGQPSPSGLGVASRTFVPNLERLGYCRASLRKTSACENGLALPLAEILVAFPGDGEHGRDGGTEVCVLLAECTSPRYGSQRLYMSPKVVLLGSVLLWIFAGLQGAESNRLIITHATVIDGTGATLQENVEVVVSGLKTVRANRNNWTNR
jgi:hypothetical protein